MMAITRISQLPEELRRSHTTASQKFFLDLLNVHDRPENEDIDDPPTVQRLREWNELLRMTRETHANAAKAESFLHGLATWMKGGAGEAEKTYPSSKKK